MVYTTLDLGRLNSSGISPKVARDHSGNFELSLLQGLSIDTSNENLLSRVQFTLLELFIKKLISFT